MVERVVKEFRDLVAQAQHIHARVRRVHVAGPDIETCDVMRHVRLVISQGGAIDVYSVFSSQRTRWLRRSAASSRAKQNSVLPTTRLRLADETKEPRFRQSDRHRKHTKRSALIRGLAMALVAMLSCQVFSCEHSFWAFRIRSDDVGPLIFGLTTSSSFFPRIASSSGRIAACGPRS